MKLLFILLLACAAIQASPLDFFHGRSSPDSTLTLSSTHKRDTSSPSPCSAEESVNCLNQATCLIVDGAPFCLCAPSFFGPTCNFQAYSAQLSGANQVPPFDTPFTGSAQAIFDTVSRGITLTGTSNVVNVTASHIHRGNAGANGAVIVVIRFNGDVMVGISPAFVLTEADAALLASVGTYVNVHNVQKPAGIIRGQLVAYDACSNVSCGQGVCLSQGFSHICHCLGGFTGESCQIPPNPCNPNPCQFTGECSPISSTSFVCNCPPGFEGAQCELPPPSCVDNVCWNGGHCYQADFLGLDFLCICPPGFFGPLCEMSGGDSFCNLSPCFNGASCNGDLVDLTPCSCPSGFFGPYCDGNPCNEAVCSSTGEAKVIKPNPVPIVSSIQYAGSLTPFTKLRIFTSISHPNNGEIQVQLISPSGLTSILSYAGPQGIADAYKGTYWTDSAQYSPFDYPFVSGVPAPELRPAMFPLSYLLPNITGTWTLIILDAFIANDGLFEGWRLEFDHEDNCQGATCEPGFVCIDGFTTKYCIHAPRPCIPGATCIMGNCVATSSGDTCQCDAPNVLGEFCATTTCPGPSCAIVGIEAPISEDLPPMKSTLFLSQQPTLPALPQIMVTVMLNHSYNDDLILTLTSPQGTKMVLAARNGGSYQNLYNFLSFGSSAQKTLVEIPISDDGPPTIPFVLPLDPFSLFAGQNPNGPWVLEVDDTQESDSGFFVGWSISFDFEDQCLTPSACPAGMVCIDSLFSVNCVCPPGTAGPSCAPVSPCNPDPCNAGFCSVSDHNEALCNCFTSLVGPHCDIPECSSNICSRSSLSPISNSLPPFMSLVMISRPGAVITSLTVGLTLSHAFSNELIISLTSPQGIKILLSNSRGGKDTFYGVTFDQQAPVSIVNYTHDFFESTFRPEESLGAFAGLSPDGIWTLEVVDQLYGEDGVFFSWSLNFPDTPTKCNGIVIDNAIFKAAPLNTLAFGACLPDFVGTPKRFCRPQGFFGPAISPCYPASLTCPPSNASNAYWPETLVLSTATGTCIPGFQGAPTRRCTVSGDWENSVSNHCQRVVCEAAIIENVSFPRTNALQKAQGTCTYGGRVTRECRADGNFGPATGSCNVPCPQDDLYGRAMWPTTLPGATAPGTCMAGWTGSPSRKCNLDGSWSSNVANSCQRRICPGEVTEQGTTFPSAAFEQTSRGSCPSGSIGSPQRQCQSNGQLGPISGTDCVSLSAKCPSETYGNAVWSETTVGSSSIGSCVAGWTGSPSRKCTLSATWESSLTNLCTRITCPATNDGVYAFNKMNSNTQAYGRCVVGTGRPWRKCDINGNPGPINGACV